MNPRFHIVFTAAAILAGCNRDVVYEDTGADPVTVFEYSPAPGQFINEMPAFAGVDTPEKAREFAEKRLNYTDPETGEREERFVSLGGFGGYIVVGFGKSIANSGGNDFSITGNQHAGSSEPGVVWVMQDTDGDGLPAGGEWYELAGSETGKETTHRGYEVTYFRPEEDNADVRWEDNMGGSGTIPRVSFHTQPSYYPAWIGAGSYTLSGTLLEARSENGGDAENWVNAPYDWGYADNLGNDRGEGRDQRKVFFKISNAVDAEGNPAGLESIDFIKVQTAVNANAGWLGEISTEVTVFAIEGPAKKR